MPEHVGGSPTQPGHGLDTDLPGVGGAGGHTGVSGCPFRCAPKAPITPHAAALALGSRAAPLSVFPPWGQGQVLSHTALWLYRCAYCAGRRSQYDNHSSSEAGAVTPLYRPETRSSKRLTSFPSSPCCTVRSQGYLLSGLPALPTRPYPTLQAILGASKLWERSLLGPPPGQQGSDGGGGQGLCGAVWGRGHPVHRCGVGVRRPGQSSLGPEGWGLAPR